MAITRRTFLAAAAALAVVGCAEKEDSLEQKIQDMVQSGYRSLASKTLQLYDSAFPLLIAGDNERAMFNRFRKRLVEIKSSGFSRTDLNDEDTFADTSLLYEKILPREATPENAQEALQLAFECLRTYGSLGLCRKS